MIAVVAPMGAHETAALVQLAEEFSPRVECGASGIALDASGVSRLFGGAEGFAREIARQAADRGLQVRVAVAATRTVATLAAQRLKSPAPFVVITAGDERQALAPLPIAALASIADLIGPALEKAAAGAPARSRRRGQGRNYRLAPAPEPSSTTPPDHEITKSLDRLQRWGLKTLGDLAALPAGELSARLGEAGLILQRAARGEDERPLVPATPAPVFMQSMRLDWPLEDLQPLSFVVSRLCESLEQALARADRGAIALTTRLRLVTPRDPGGGLGEKAVHARTLTLPAPMRDARVMRTLVMLDLESHPPGAAVDEIVIDVDVAPGRILQTGLFAPAIPAPETLSTLVARLGALVGASRVGAPSVVDTHRPGAFAMAAFAPHAARPPATGHRSQGSGPAREISRSSVVETGSRHWPEAYGLWPDHIPAVIRRFRPPRPARVRAGEGRPSRVEAGEIRGDVVTAAGPWRTSGGWWEAAWDRDEWDVALDTGLACRLAQDRVTGTWVVDGVLD